MSPKQFESELNYLITRHPAECFMKHRIFTKNRVQENRRYSYQDIHPAY